MSQKREAQQERETTNDVDKGSDEEQPTVGPQKDRPYLVGKRAGVPNRDGQSQYQEGSISGIDRGITQNLPSQEPIQKGPHQETSSSIKAIP
jgi:hypothetical protein